MSFGNYFKGLKLGSFMGKLPQGNMKGSSSMKHIVAFIALIIGISVAGYIAAGSPTANGLYNAFTTDTQIFLNTNYNALFWTLIGVFLLGALITIEAKTHIVRQAFHK